jgi:hypothetical protein
MWDMNQIEWLEQLLDKEKERLFIARQNLKNNPLSYSAKVAIQSAERSLAELKNSLQNERKKHTSQRHRRLNTR